ncbi:hypothetical protein A1Q2_06757 [Trichosporon asahii var. asahii CBS 8904]|uniref:Uncharacterized protein n=1 Tax=Trichosporon asahii var. asahii (strain CBS 8904) TaxID=1220162 RepID=K1WBF1_TRIAC|nr:hypothetical protein A1Q2_06757 [Trichosporon asahii var. asahii CBS 8904]
MKRKHGSDSGSDSAADSAADSGSDFQPSPTPAPVNKKPNVKPDIKPDIKPKVTKSPTKRASPSKAGGSGKLPPGSKAALASLIVQRGLASLPSHAECAEITGMTPAQVRNQLDPRKGVRKKLQKLAETLG